EDRIVPRARRQPIQIADGAYVIAVTRIETNKEMGHRPVGSEEQIAKAATLIKSTMDLPNVRAIQIDFDAVVSERKFYRALMNKLRVEIPSTVPISMTSLASWCTGDAWFNDF